MNIPSHLASHSDSDHGWCRDRPRGSPCQVGPHQAHIFKQLDDMDTDGDGVVTKKEMLAFFEVPPPPPLSPAPTCP